MAKAGFSDLERSLGIATRLLWMPSSDSLGFSDLERSLDIATRGRLGGVLAGAVSVTSNGR